MYLKNILILESGPIKDFQYDLEFEDNGNPKPTIIVGQNGSGKSNLLSFVTDALIEIAVKTFNDAAPGNNFGRHSWHRIIGGQTIRTGSQFELALLRFADHDDAYTYVSKGGNLRKADVQARLNSFPQAANWSENGAHKDVTGPDAPIEMIYRKGCYLSFPSSRSEEPYWARNVTTAEDSHFEGQFTNLLGKPISVVSVLDDLKPWLVDVILDHTVDIHSLIPLVRDQEKLISAIANVANKSNSLTNFNLVLRTVLETPKARLVRTGRRAGPGKLQVYDGQKPIVPTFDSFSSGQAALIGIFGTILRYADKENPSLPTQEIRGIVLVDEIDTHLHADMQHNVLPQLISFFPKVQFIVSAHAPLVPLGMERIFGPEGFSLLEMPTGMKITAERFSEFHSSLRHLRDTRSFDEMVVQRIDELQRPRVLCEGSTDPKYFTTAAKLLGFTDLIEGVDFDWIGVRENGQAKDGGKDRLYQAQRILRNNPSILKFRAVLLFDCDHKKPEMDDGRLHVRVLDKNLQNTRCDKGVENLLPPCVFEDRFFKIETHRNGADEIQTKKLKKTELCDFLCDEKRDPVDFEGFRTTLQMLHEVVFPE